MPLVVIINVNATFISVQGQGIGYSYPPGPFPFSRDQSQPVRASVPVLLPFLFDLLLRNTKVAQVSNTCCLHGARFCKCNENKK